MPHPPPRPARTLTGTFVIAVVAAASIILAASAGAATRTGRLVDPIQPANRGAPIPGAVNGELDPGLLQTVEGSCRLAHGAAGALGHLLADASAQGVALGPEDCYRPVDRQSQDHTHACQSGNCACAAAGGPPSTGGTSIHGWGKAVDFEEGGSELTFSSRGYHWLKGNASRYGFNHPSWAEPGGSPCPEAWHWEWVGDGGTLAPPPVAVGIVATPSGSGYRVANSFGVVDPFGDASYEGWADVGRLVYPVTAVAATSDGGGYWLATADGAVLSFGTAPARRSAPTPPAAPVVGMAASPAGQGCWLVGADGGVFAEGGAAFHGSTGAVRLNQPIVGMAPTPSGNGYWLVAADGGVFSFGDAAFHGSTGAVRLNQPIVGMAPTPSGNGYWLVAADGGVFTEGDAPYQGSSA